MSRIWIWANLKFAVLILKIVVVQHFYFYLQQYQVKYLILKKTYVHPPELVLPYLLVSRDPEVVAPRHTGRKLLS